MGSTYNNVRNSQTLLSQLQKAEAEEMKSMYRADELEVMF